VGISECMYWMPKSRIPQIIRQVVTHLPLPLYDIYEKYSSFAERGDGAVSYKYRYGVPAVEYGVTGFSPLSLDLNPPYFSLSITLLLGTSACAPLLYKDQHDHLLEYRYPSRKVFHSPPKKTKASFTWGPTVAVRLPLIPHLDITRYPCASKNPYRTPILRYFFLPHVLAAGKKYS